MRESAADLIGCASRLAEVAHERSGKRRKFTGEPYIVHPRAVAAIVESVPHVPEMVAAAWLHDTLEDTDLTQDDIEALCGTEVARLVVAVTKPAGARGINLGDFYARIALQGSRAATLKLADIIDNASTVMARDPAWGAPYLAKIRTAIGRLELGDASLYGRALAIVGA